MLKNISKTFIILAITLLIYNNLYNYYLNKKEELKVNEFIKENQTNINVVKLEEITNEIKNINNFLGVISIPKINLNQGFYNLEDINNDVNKTIELLPSDMPNVLNGTLILASHSGNSRISYFKNLDKLSIDDYIYIYYDKQKYTYILTKIYEVEKTGEVTIHKNNNTTTLVLITCSKNNNKQVVYIANLI